MVLPVGVSDAHLISICGIKFAFDLASLKASVMLFGDPYFSLIHSLPLKTIWPLKPCL